MAFLQERKKLYPDARHHVYAWLLGGAGEQKLQRFSDDGEPQGTAGPPVLDVLVRGNIYDTMIVVTRYFGGILLGTGGLVKAYGGAATGVIAEAGLMEMLPGRRYLVRFPYHFVDQLQYQLGQTGIEIAEKHFGHEVSFTCLVESGKETDFLRLVTANLRGQAEVSRGEEILLPQMVKEKANGNYGN